MRAAKLLNPVAYIRFLANLARRLPSMVATAENWPAWMVRQLLRPALTLPLWIRTRAGTRIYLGADPIDDAVLLHVMRDAVSVYFPAHAHVPPGGLALDVGAHHGVYATELLRRSPGARLIAVEPNPEARVYFERNLRGNGMFDRVEYVEAGLSDRTGPGRLWLGAESWDHSTVTTSNEAGSSGIPVRLMSTADVLRGRHPYLVKLNAEGAEFEVVRDLFASGVRPQWIVLMIHPDSGPHSALRELVLDAGYDIRPADGRPDSLRLHCRLRGSE
jgi:FkbM family methyltransferase